MPSLLILWKVSGWVWNNPHRIYHFQKPFVGMVNVVSNPACLGICLKQIGMSTHPDKINSHF